MISALGEIGLTVTSGRVNTATETIAALRKRSSVGRLWWAIVSQTNSFDSLGRFMLSSRLRYFLFCVLVLGNVVSLGAADLAPNNLEEAFSVLDQKLSPEARQQFKQTPEVEAVTMAHMSLGLFIRNEWFRSGGSKLPGLLQGMGARHKDDMSSIVLTSYWRKLNGKPLELEQQGECYRLWWQEQERLANASKSRGASSHGYPSFSCP